MTRRASLLACLFLGLPVSGLAQDGAGDVFEEAELLPFGQFSVSEPLQTEFLGADLILRALDSDGSELDFNDDDSRFGDTLAPGLEFVPINPGGEIDFQISGFGDENFVGDHIEFGDFDAYVDIYDEEFVFLDGFVVSGSIDGFVAEDAVYSFFDANAAWDGAFYDININNAFPNDVDFFVFSGLTPGEPFTAETLEVPGTDLIDTVLGLFDDFGNLIASDDDGGEFNYSKLAGTVPASGEVTLAVSGFGDIDFFEGLHPFLGEYELVVAEGGGPVVGDYNNDGDVDADDYTAWKSAYASTGTELAADGNNDGIVDAADYTIWRDAFDATQATAVPEPAGMAWLVLAGAGVGRRRA